MSQHSCPIGEYVFLSKFIIDIIAHNADIVKAAERNSIKCNINVITHELIYI